MIINSKNVVYTVMEFDRDELIALLLGKNIEKEEDSFDEGLIPTRFNIHCSNPMTIDMLLRIIEEKANLDCKCKY